jgi:hypothetical protein
MFAVTRNPTAHCDEALKSIANAQPLSARLPDPAAFALDQEVLPPDYEPGLPPAVKYLMDGSGRDFAVVQEAPQSS